MTRGYSVGKTFKPVDARMSRCERLSQGAACFDEAALLHHVGGDLELLREVVEIFLATVPQMLADVRDGVTNGDCQKVEGAAHALRGTASNFVAARVEQAALVLETMGRSRDLAQAARACGVLEAELDKLRFSLGRCFPGR